MTIHIAVVGLGKIARDQHLPVIAASDAFTLAAVVDRSGSGVAGVPCARSFEALAGLGVRVDAVALCTPPQARGALALAAIEAGWAVLLEKPPAPTLGGIEAIVARAQAARVPLLASWHSRYAPQIAAARAWLSDKRVTGGQIRWRESARKWHPGQHWLWQPGGLGVFDPGINGLSILSALLPAPIIVQAARFDVPEGAAAPIAAQLHLLHDGAAIAGDFDFREEDGERWEIRLETDAGALELSAGGAMLALPGAPPISAVAAEYRALYADFAQVVQAGAIVADAAPLRIVADAFLVAEMVPVARFDP